jgi:hypothetical protein
MQNSPFYSPGADNIFGELEILNYVDEYDKIDQGMRELM